MKLMKMNIDELTPAYYNPRKELQPDDAEYIKLKRSIETFGYVEPVVFNEQTGTVVGGHQRINVLKDLGYTDIDVSVINVSEQKEKALNVALNKISGDFDATLLKSLIDELESEDFDISLTGFDFGDMDEIMNEAFPENEEFEENESVEDDFDVGEALPEVAKTQRGDLYQLGNHRLLCGDSTDHGDSKRLMNGNEASLLFTSPPYADMRTYNDSDNLTVEHLVKFIGNFKKYTDYQVVNLGISRKEHSIFRYWDDYINEAERIGYKTLAWNIWDKVSAGSIGNQRSFFPLTHEWVFVFGTEYYEVNPTHKKSESSIKKERGVSVVRDPDGTKSNTTSGDLSRTHKKMSSVLSLQPERGEVTKSHPATFPVALPTEYILSMSNKGENIIEPFGGSGSTLIASEQTERNCYIMELDEKYCDVIVKRWEELTGEKAVKL